MNRLKSANLIAGIALFTLIALPILYVFSMPIVVEHTSGDFQKDYVLPFYAPLNSTLNDYPLLSSACDPWLRHFGCDRGKICESHVFVELLCSPMLDKESIYPFSDEFEFTDEELQEWTELISKRNDE